ncbi:MAG: hypothetical protein D6775_00760 [Caldilineae bacterium]|nr:MAG: hypothetical protein D6775_00760 [Caldilineae bacterium]
MSEPSIERLIYLLRTADPESRVDAARRLAEQAADPAAHQGLYEASFMRDHRLRRIAAGALAACPDERNLVRLADLLADRRAEVRQAAAEALCELGDPGATLPLMDALNDSNRWVVLAALEGLGRFGKPIARKRVRALIGSRDWGISRAARRAIAKMEARQG